MSRLIKDTSKKIGQAPGTLAFIGTNKNKQTKISIIDYNKTNFSEKITKNIEECFKYKNKKSITWINVDGLNDTKSIEKIGNYFEIHPLILEDIVNTSQRPKIEILDNQIFITIKMLTLNKKEFKIKSEQISIVLGKNYVISFQEKPGDILEPLRNRIRKGIGKIRNMNSDYLLYSILDIITDYYFNILEKIGEKIENFEEELIEEPKPNTLNEIYKLKRETLFVRKAIWPLRETINKLEKSESQLIYKKTTPYIRDLYDHTIQIIDTIETSRDLLSGMLELYLSSTSNKMNEVMKVLTIFAAIFIPLTFIAGIYGTNFDNIPELHWKYGYFIMLGIMTALGTGLLIFFKKKKWL